MAAEPVVWDDPTVNWAGFDLAVIRSCWDYVPRRAEFLAWAQGVPRLANPPEVLAWNTDKRYLQELAAVGLPVVPTTWVAPGRPWTAPARGEWVLKPAISLAALDSGRYRFGDPQQRRLAVGHLRRLQAAGRVVMVQPYLHAVDTDGETALVYLGGRFSHAIRKGPVLDGPDTGVDRRAHARAAAGGRPGAAGGRRGGDRCCPGGQGGRLGAPADRGVAGPAGVHGAGLAAPIRRASGAAAGGVHQAAVRAGPGPAGARARWISGGGCGGGDHRRGWGGGAPVGPGAGRVVAVGVGCRRHCGAVAWAFQHGGGAQHQLPLVRRASAKQPRRGRSPSRVEEASRCPSPTPTTRRATGPSGPAGWRCSAMSSSRTSSTLPFPAASADGWSANWPNTPTKARSVSRCGCPGPTIDRWVRWWRAGGFEALVPTPARVSARTPAEVLALAAALKRERPERTAAQVTRILRAQSGWATSERTLQRHFVRLELDHKVQADPPVFGRFQADRPNELWTGDALHGPVICGRKTFLFCFIDDHSRAVMGARFGYHEDTVRLAAALRPALAARGVPEQIYVDNGSPFVDSWLLRACAVLGIRLVHSTPRRPQGRGKIERFFRTVRSQFLVELDGQAAERVADLAELNRLLVAWVETDYHPQVHSETAAPPLRRWREALPDPLPRPTPAQLREAFLWAEHRTVTTNATVSLHNNTYQVDPLLVGRKVELVFDPFDLTDIQVRHQQRTFGKAVAFRIGRHAHPKARPEQPDTGPPPPTGIDYLRLLQVAHQQQLATRINYAALADVDADGHHHPQLGPADRHDHSGPAQPAPDGQIPGQLALTHQAHVDPDQERS